jgi:hypothetical protein
MELPFETNNQRRRCRISMNNIDGEIFFDSVEGERKLIFSVAPRAGRSFLSCHLLTFRDMHKNLLCIGSPLALASPFFHS